MDKKTNKALHTVTVISEQVVGTAYDVTDQVPKEIKNNGKRYKLVGLKSGNPKRESTPR